LAVLYPDPPVQVSVTLNSATLDPAELQTIPAPTIDSTRSNATINVFSMWQLGDWGLDSLCPELAPIEMGTNYILFGNLGTNVVNFERSTLRVNREAGTANVRVYRAYVGGGNFSGYADYSQASTIYYTIDAYNTFDDWNTFPLQSGSDYAIPDLATKTAAEGVVDFASPAWGTLVFPANSYPAGAIQTISIPITNNDTVEFNKDIHIMLDMDAGHLWQYALPGEITECWVTILYDKQPAGAADRTYNVDNVSYTSSPYDTLPGANGPVYGVAVQPADGKGIIVGDFTAYDQTNANMIARALPNGQPDAAFIATTGSGADGFIDAVAVDSSGGIFIGGAFASFNGNPSQRNGIARLNPDGSLDTTQFQPGYGANGIVSAILIQPNGQILIAGDFTTYNTNNVNCIARLNPDGSLDTTFNPGVGPDYDILSSETVINAMALQPDGKIVIGGFFDTVDGSSRNNIARLNADGSLDTTFDPGIGANDVVNAVAVDANGLILVGGAFKQLGTAGASEGIQRLYADGSVDTTFNSGSGTDGAVNAILLQPDGGILLGGVFTSINQTRRISLARLLTDGSLDTSFMDTAYNQFAGLINPYYNPAVNSPNPISCMALQADTNILIGGTFTQVGGGTSRGDIRPRWNVARIIGGATPGPGNIALGYGSYAVSGQSTNSYATITIDRNNGSLGPAIATLEPVTLHPGPGAAVYGGDFIFSATPVLYGTTWSSTWMLSDGVAGASYNTAVTILATNDANTTLNLQLTQPIGSDIFFLGGNNKQTSVGLLNAKYTAQDGENIPLGVALGASSAPLSIIRNNVKPGVLGFSSPFYSTNQNSGVAYIMVVRNNGSDGNVTVKYLTVDGTAKAGTDYKAASGTLTFLAGKTNVIIPIQLDSGSSYGPDKYLSIQLYGPGPTGSSPTLGQTNAELVLINNNYSGGNVSFDGGLPLVLGTTNLMTYGTNEDRVAAQITVTRQGGSTGLLKVGVATSDGTAKNGVNYTGFTNYLTWNDGISGPQTLTLPVQRDYVVTSNLTVNLRLFNSTVNGSASSVALGGAFTNAILTITNVDQTGTLSFSLASYSVNQDGGMAIIPVVRSNGTAGTITALLSTFDGTAFSNTDYYATNYLVTFTNGQMSESFRVPIIANNNVGPNVAFTMLLTNASPTNALGSPNVATINIVNSETYNEPPGSIDPTYDPSAGFNGPVYALALEPSDGKLIVGGSFTTANGVGRRHIARMNADGTLDSKFSSYLTTQGASDTVRSVVVQTDGRILVGGAFTNFNGTALNHIARLNYDGSLDSTFTPGSGAGNTIYAMAEAFINGVRKLYVGGPFATYGGMGQNAIARLNNDGSLDNGFATGVGPNGPVYAVAVQTDGKVVIGGDFTAVNGYTNFNHIARLNTDGSVDSSFNPGSGPDNSVHSLAVQLDGRIILGGLFMNVNGQSYNHIARLNTDGTIDTGFTPGVGANGDVQSISLQSDTRIILGGTFTKCNGVTRNYITRLNPDGTVDPTINFGIGADGFVAATVIQPDTKIILGGGFLHYDGVSHPYLVRIFGGSMTGSGGLQFTTANYWVHESATNATITVIRTGGTSGPNADGTGDIYVSYYTSPGTAVDPANYTDVSGVLDFPAGEVLQSFTVPVTDDGVLMPTLTVNLMLTNATSPAVIGNQPEAVLNILNDDSTISFSSSQYSDPKNVVNGVAPINLIRAGGTNGTSTVNFLIVGGSASSGSDYEAVNQTVIFNPGVTNVVVNIPILNNPNPEGNLTVLMAITNAAGSMLAAPTNATLTIVDIVDSPGELSFVSPTYSVTEGGGTGYTNVTITVQRTLGSVGTVSVDYSTLDGSAASGTKYQPTNGVLTFADGETSKSFFVGVRNTTTAEGPETFSVYLYGLQGSATLVDPTNTVVTILNTNIGIAFASAANAYTEPSGLVDGNLLLSVVRYNNTNGTTTVNYATTNGSAVSPTDFVGTNGTLTFYPGDTVKNIAITTVHDANITGDLQFTVGLSSPGAGAQLTYPSYTVVTDHDADAGISLYTNAASVYRNAGYVYIIVTNSNPAVEPFTVNYATSDGSALAGTDYTAVSGTLSFTNAAIYNYFAVPILLNNAVQTNRQFTVSLSSPTAPGVLWGYSSETVTLIGTNTPPGLSFSTPIIISGLWGSTNGNNTQGAAEANDPNIAGQPANAPVWFKWTAPAGVSGEVTLDTIGSAETNGLKLDTVLEVYTGTSLNNLNEVAANDDLYPNYPVTQFNETAQNIFNTNQVPVLAGYSEIYSNGGYQYQFYYTTNNGEYIGELYEYLQPLAGPSGLRFNATGGTTYYIAVDSKSSSTYTISNGILMLVTAGRGTLDLSWAYHPGGVFRFATENVDQNIMQTNGNPMLLYQCAETEGASYGDGHRIIGPTDVNLYDTTLHAYYNYDVAGLLVTVTRVAGASGRMMVDYYTMDGTTNIINNGDIPAIGGIDYLAVSNTLVFDDFEMSKTIRIPIMDDMGRLYQYRQNRDFTVVLSNPRRDPAESGSVSTPRVDPVFGQVLCRILDCDIDPRGPTTLSTVVTNILGVVSTNYSIADQNGHLFAPTNALFNFSKANYRVCRDAQAWWNNGSVPIAVYVNRMGTNTSSVTVHYRFDNYFLDQDTTDDRNDEFPLQPASDYAVPTPATTAGVAGTNSDFAGVGGESGTLTFPGGTKNPYQSLPIQFNVSNNHVTGFNKDIHICLYVDNANNVPEQAGMVAETTVTILFDDTVPPAGSVDQLYNPDFATDLAILTNSVNLNSTVLQPGTDPQGEVYAVALATNGEAIIGGAFATYTDSTNTYTVNGIARLNTDGSLDTTFNPGGSGVNITGGDFIRSLALTTDGKVVIGGDFTSFNGVGRNYVARLNADGTLDTTFKPGGGANGEVWSVLVQGDGKVVIGGEFTTYNGAPVNYLARLNTDGSLDSTFNSSNLISGPVYTVAAPPSTVLNFSHSASGGPQEDDQTLNLGSITSGVLNVSYNMLAIPDDMRIFYGTTNVAAGTGVLLFDTGNVSGAANISVPFGPTNGLTATTLTIVMNQGGSTNTGTAWMYTASVSVPTTTGLLIGGNFGVNGQSYANIARLNPDGTLDSTFNPGTGPDGPVYALAWQLDNRVLLGGDFKNLSGSPFSRLARLNSDGSIDTAFYNSFGADNTVYSINLQPLSGIIYVGGLFTEINGTHRLGFARLNSDGTVDTTFLDTAYNQFAGLARIFYSDSGAVYSSAVQGDGNVIIGGSFQEVGGGQADYLTRYVVEEARGLLPSTANADLLVSEGGSALEPKTRDGVRNHSNVARLIGGATPGPGNIGMVNSSYAVNKTQIAEPVNLVRNNGSLGYASANFSVLPQLAQSGSDYAYSGVPPLYPIAWEYSGPTRNHIDGLFGADGLMQDTYGRYYKYGVNGPASILVNIIDDTAVAGNLSANLQMANPSQQDMFYLGGQDIPVGVALGISQAPMTLIDNSHMDGTFGFSSSVYVGTNSPYSVTILRTNGSYGSVQLSYQTTTNGSSAVLNTDYYATNGVLTFASGQTSGSFPVTLLSKPYVSVQEKELTLQLYNIQDLSGGTAQLGLTNATIRLINQNFPGYLTFSTNQYVANLSAGVLTFTVARTVGSKGTLTVQYGTSDTGTTTFNARNGTNYVGSTNTLKWVDGDVSARTVSIPLINHNTGGGITQFKASLFNPTLNQVPVTDGSLFGAITNANLYIYNDNSYGTFQLSSRVYRYNENGGFATITVTRSGSLANTAQVAYNTVDGTAFAGTNYVATNNVLTFTNGQAAESFRVQLIDDGKTNPPPASFYFNVDMAVLTSYARPGVPTNAVVQIVDAESYNQQPGALDPSFDPSASLNASVLSLALQSSGQIVAGGSFTVASGSSMNRVARFNTDGTLDTSFMKGLTGPDGTVNTVADQTDDRILMGGNFLNVDGVGRQYIARLMTDGTLDTSFNPGAGADNTVYALSETFINGARGIYVGGAFSTYDNNPSPGVVRLNNTGLVDFSFNVGYGAIGTVYAVQAYPTNSVANAGQVLVGGSFTNFNGMVVSNLVRLSASGALDTNFSQNLNIGGAVRAVAIQVDGKVIIGGDFTNINNTVANHLARLNPDGTLDTAFAAAAAPAVNGTVDTIALQQDGGIVLGGQFSTANGVTRGNITRLLPTGAADPTINFGSGANATVNAAVIQPVDGNIVIGGAFTAYNGATREHIARIFGGSMTGSGAFQFTTANYQIDENASFATISIERTGGTSGTNADGSGDVHVAFATVSGGSAVPGTNYTYTTNYLDFPAGEVLKTVAVPVMDDGVITTNLSVNLALSNPTTPGTTLGDQPNAVLTIINDDSTVEFSSASYSVPKNVPTGLANINLSRVGSTSGSCTVYFTTTTNGNAVIGTDYTPTNATVTFYPGDTNELIQVAITNNLLPEGPRTVTMALSNAVNTVQGWPSNAVLTIQDTTTNPGSLFFTATNYSAKASDGFAYLTVTRTNGTHGGVTVTYVTKSLAPATNAATSQDYTTVTNGTLSFNDGDMNKNIAIPLINNQVPKPPVIFEVDLSNPTGGAGLIAPTNAVVTIINTNAAIQFALATNTVPEDAGSANIIVQRINNTNIVSFIHYATVDGTVAGASAVQGINYSNTAGTLVFGVGEVYKAISIPLINQSNTLSLMFGVNLSNPTNAALIVPSNTVVVLEGSAAGVSFLTNVTTVAKSAGSVAISVICSNPRVATNSLVPVTVGYSTVDGTAKAGINYVAQSGVLNFTSGGITNPITVGILNNGPFGNLTFSVILTNVTGPAYITPIGTNLVTLTESSSGVSFSQSAYSAFKNAGQVTITAYRTGNTNSIVAVNYYVTNETAITGQNFYATNGTLTFTNGVTSQSFDVTLIANSSQQQNLVALMGLYSPTNLTDGSLVQIIKPGIATLTILQANGSYVVPAGSQLLSNSSATDASLGVIGSNDVVQVLFAFRDAAGQNVTNLVAYLQATNGVSSPSPAYQGYGKLVVYGHSVSQPFTFTAKGTNSYTISPTFKLYDGTNGTYIGPATFNFTLGTWPTTFVNTNLIIINPNLSGAAAGAPASIYPSIIEVTNVGTTLVKATVTLTNLSLESIYDVSALVVSPTTNTLLMGNVSQSGTIIKHVTFTFDDAAANSLPVGTSTATPVTSTNKPTQYYGYPINNFP
jgi:uncharacterized delta-60 repeat protein